MIFIVGVVDFNSWVWCVPDLSFQKVEGMISADVDPCIPLCLFGHHAGAIPGFQKCRPPQHIGSKPGVQPELPFDMPDRCLELEHLP